jgi:type VI secretion system secreted protein VgrG
MSTTSNNLKLAFANGNDALDVRHFSVHETVNELFEVSILAISDDVDIKIDDLVGKGAAFKLQTPNHQATHDTRVWAGVVAHMSQVHAEPAPGQSMYHLMIVPDLWRTTLRKNNRIYEHKDTPTIVRELLMEWKIDVVNKLKDKYPWHEYCVQYGETDYDFVCRLLEDAGITYFFHQDATSGKGAAITKLVLTDKPTDKEFERKGKLAYAGHATPRFGADEDFCASVTVTQRVKPGKFILRDYNFRAPLLKSIATGVSGKAEEDKYEQYDYLPGGFWWDTKKVTDPVADRDHGPNNDEAGEGKKLIQRSLEAERRRRLLVSFHTNAIDLAPGKLVGINQESTKKNHPRASLAPDKKLLLIETHLEGQHNGEWSMTATGVFAAQPYRPERKTPKPRIHGLQSAFVVGPPGEEIFTDEFGRVRVQFHWDREHVYDDKSSCWVRVSQNWAGGKFGMMNIPRVGHEVLVGFFDGDLDRPIIMGRVHNETSPVPWTLPDNATKSGWRSNSLPSKSHLGYNELSFEDSAGNEDLHIQAEKNLSYVVKSAETSNIGNARSVTIGKSDSVDVGKTMTVHVGETHMTGVGEEYDLSIGPTTGYRIKDKSIVSSTGLGCITLTNGDISLDGGGQIRIHAGKGVVISSSGGEIKIQGGPQVRFDDVGEGPAPQVAKVPAADPPAGPAGGPVGTKPVIPSGKGSFDLPGPVDDVDTSPKPPPAATPPAGGAHGGAAHPHGAPIPPGTTTVTRGTTTITTDHVAKTITMTGTQTYVGPGANQAYANRAAAEINSTWSGPTTIDGTRYQVTSNIQGVVGTTPAGATSAGPNQVWVTATGGPETRQTDPANQSYYGATGGYQHAQEDSDGGLTIAHEFGHSMGLKDEYHEGPRNADGTRSIVRTGPAGGLMGYIDAGSKPTSANFRSLITGVGLH